MPASVASPYQALYWFNSSPLLLLGSLSRITHRRASLFLIKLLWKRGKSRRGRSCVEAFFRRSKILHRSVYSTLALWLGGLRCQYGRQSNHWLIAVPEWWSLAKKQIHSVGPLSASAHRENARYARLPIQPWLCFSQSQITGITFYCSTSPSTSFHSHSLQLFYFANMY